MKPMMIMKGGCVFLYLVLIGLVLGCLIGYWRNVHNTPEEFDIDGKKVYLGPVNDLIPDVIALKFGLINNCAIPGSQIDCVWPESFAFEGDIGNLVMICLALVVYIFTGAAMALSMYNDRIIKPHYLFVLPFTTLMGEVLLAGTVAIFLIFYRTAIRPKFPEYINIAAAGATSLYVVNEDYITGPLPTKVSYGEAFYICIVAMILGIAEIAASGFVAYICITEADKAEDQKANNGYVVQQKVVKEVEVVKEEVAEEDEDVESAVERKPAKKAKKAQAQKPSRKSKPSINAPAKKKKNKTQSGSQQSEVKVDDESKKSKSEKPLSSLKSVSEMKVKIGSDRSLGKKKRAVEHGYEEEE